MKFNAVFFGSKGGTVPTHDHERPGKVNMFHQCFFGFPGFQVVLLVKSCLTGQEGWKAVFSKLVLKTWKTFRIKTDDYAMAQNYGTKHVQKKFLRQTYPNISKKDGTSTNHRVDSVEPYPDDSFQVAALKPLPVQPVQDMPCMQHLCALDLEEVQRFSDPHVIADI